MQPEFTRGLYVKLRQAVVYCVSIVVYKSKLHCLRYLVASDSNVTVLSLTDKLLARSS